MLKLLCVLMFFDYLVTYIGIQKGWIFEWNPVIEMQMSLPLVVSFGVRILTIALVYWFFTWLKEQNKILSYRTKEGFSLYFKHKNVMDKTLTVATSFFIFITFIHILWIYDAIKGGL